MKKYVLLSIIALFIFAGCLGDLSRGQAKKVLSQKKGVVTRTIPHKIFIHSRLEKIRPFTSHLNPVTQQWEGGVKEVVERNGDAAQKAFIESLQYQGYLEVRNHQEEARNLLTKEVYAWYDYYLIFSADKLRPFISRDNNNHIEVVVAETTVDDITGIVKVDENSREVKFKTKTVRTEIGKYFELKTYELKPRNRTAYFRKYDDGWRLEGGW